MTHARTFVLLCVIGVCCFLSYNLVRMPALSLFAQSLGAGPEQIGLIVSASTLTGVFLKLPAGALSDIYGRTFMLRLGILAFALPPFAYPAVTGLGALIGLRFLHGAATALFGPSATASVAEMHKERRGAALGWYTASTQAGALLGPVLGGWLVHAAGFPLTFATAGVIGCLGLAGFVLLRLNAPPPPVAAHGLRPVAAEMWKGFTIVARNTKVLATSLTDGAKKIADGALMAFLPLYGVAVGLTPAEVGLLFGVQGVTSFLSKPVMGVASDRIGRRPLILVGLLIGAGTFVLIPHVTGLTALLLLSAGFGFGEAVVTSSTSALVADLSELRTMGAGMGMQGTINDIGHAAGPLVAGFLIAGLNYRQAFAIIAGVQVAAASLFWLAMRKH
jgi:MFS family permease